MDDSFPNSSVFRPPSPVLDRFCSPDDGTTSLPDPALTSLKSTFRCIMVAISLIGVAGNVLNLVTLRSPSLRNVPFMFIRALALFDLISLAAILLHFVLDSVHINANPVVFYEVWVQDVLINSFLVAGLYCAVLLTIERYLLIRKPFTTGGRLLSIESTVLVKICFALLLAIFLHSPMALQNKAKCTRMEAGECAGHWAKGNNVELLCHQPAWALFNYYKMGRECLRFFCVLLLIVLNAKVARSLQVAKRNRRLLIKRVSMPPEPQQQQHTQLLATPTNGDLKGAKREMNSLMRSFTEKKLTALMVAICVIFAFGNIPQMVVMVIQNESLEHSYKFQVFRQLANTAEVLNHCLNFFIFCMASSEYCRAFLSLSPVRCLLHHFPLCASLANARLNGHFEATALTTAINESAASNSVHFGAQQQSFKSAKTTAENGQIASEPLKERTNPKGTQGEGAARGMAAGNSPKSGDSAGGKMPVPMNKGKGGRECIWQHTTTMALIGEEHDDFL
ncbi:hypothetical protein niasHS_010963 [Heterodera schachtii]|uniref:G-protein coupled receptors family 1 profile domain-containing protein n=1 Tax=Heterodera schachtii TaxID=97005 RepID=A0ABD2IV81_HETSC